MRNAVIVTNYSITFPHIPEDGHPYPEKGAEVTIDFEVHPKARTEKFLKEMSEDEILERIGKALTKALGLSIEGIGKKKKSNKAWYIERNNSDRGPFVTTSKKLAKELMKVDWYTVTETRILFE